MKKTLWLVLTVFLLTGCAGKPKEMERALALRTRLLQASQCRFDAEITADYGDKLCYFGLDCTFDKNGDLCFRVTAPETISGITGSISWEGGKLTFDDTVLYYELLTDEQLSPISAPWILMKALRGGYITSAGEDSGSLRICVNDSYEEDALNLDIWTNGEDIPVKADICYAGRRILSLKLENVVIS